MPCLLSMMLSDDGTLGRPGMVMISPQIATTSNPGPGRQPHLAHRQRMPRRRAALDSGRWRTSTASSPCTPAGGHSPASSHCLQLVPDLLVRLHLFCPVDLAWPLVSIFSMQQAHLVGVQGREVGLMPLSAIAATRVASSVTPFEPCSQCLHRIASLNPGSPT